MTLSRPLASLRVVEIGDSMAVGMCGKYLAELGATVAVERPVDADIVLYAGEGVAPATATSTITASITDHGEVGPQAGVGGGSLITQASSGLLSLIGEPDRSPLALGGEQLHFSAGLALFTGVMLALYGRSATGRGQHVTTSLLETAAYIEWKGRVYSQSGKDLVRGERSGPMVISCSDGLFGFYHRASDWPAVLTVFDSIRLAVPPFLTQEDRIENREQLAATLSELCSQVTRDELYHRLQAAGVPAGPIDDADDLLLDPQYTPREFISPVRGGDAPPSQPGLPVRFNDVRPSASTTT